MPKSRGRKVSPRKPRRPGSQGRPVTDQSEPKPTHELPDFDHPDFLALLARARKAEEHSTPRKHHIVPESYLERWSEQNKIRVTEVDTNHTYLTSPGRAARVTDYYRVESEDIDPELVPPLFFEVFFSMTEGTGKQVIDELVGTGDPDTLDPDLRATFAYYMALQHTRGQTYRAQHRKHANDLFQTIYRDTTEASVRALLLRNNKEEPTNEAVQELSQAIADLQDGSLVVEPQAAATVGQAVKSAMAIGGYLYARKWVLYRTAPVLLTCDEPVVLVGGPGLPRGERAGVGNAAVVLFPLAPDALLAMFRPDVPLPAAFGLDHADIAEVNREIVANSARWAFERPSRDVAVRLQIPPPAEPTAVQTFTNPDRPNETLVRNFRPSRWSNAEIVPDWPVARWWTA
jgi:hypothetical protein